MRKILVPLLAVLLCITCKKHDPETKIQVCHHDQKEGTSHTITISASELPAHLAHGDLPGVCPVVTITICDQTWMAKNLDVDHYRNGDPIPQVTDATEWKNLTTGAWCYYENSLANGAVYGKLYNWYAVNDARGLAPAGWHIPTDAEWTTLETCLNEIAPTGNVGGKMKETGTTHWDFPNADATNSSGFTGLPGGHRSYAGQFTIIGDSGVWWSSTEADAIGGVWGRYLISHDGLIYGSYSLKLEGLSIRCVRD
jgi:uncharacterized protein (TIGR02145 family)